jgi:hypothetical protein
MSPVNDYLGPLVAEALAPLVQAKAVEIVYGGREVRQPARAQAIGILFGSQAQHPVVQQQLDPELCHT